MQLSPEMRRKWRGRDPAHTIEWLALLAHEQGITTEEACSRVISMYRKEFAEFRAQQQHKNAPPHPHFKIGTVNGEITVRPRYVCAHNIASAKEVEEIMTTHFIIEDNTRPLGFEYTIEDPQEGIIDYGCWMQGVRGAQFDFEEDNQEIYFNEAVHVSKDGEPVQNKRRVHSGQYVPENSPGGGVQQQSNAGRLGRFPQQ